MCYGVNIKVLELVLVWDFYITILIDKREHPIIQPRLNKFTNMLLDIKLKHNLTYPISITDAGKCSYCFQRQVSDLLLGVIKELQYRIHYLIGIKLVLVYRAQEALDQQIKKFFTNVPI